MDELRFIARSLSRRPGVVLGILVTLALGVGFNAAAASILSALLQRPYPFPELSRLVIVRDNRPNEGLHQRNPIAAADYLDLRRHVRAFTSIAGWRPVSLVVGGSGEPAAIQGVEASADFFETLGVRPLAGRTFRAGEDESGRDDIVVFSRRFWNSHFGADAGVVGRAVALNGRSTVIVGLISDDQCYPPGVDAWVPMVLTAGDRRERTVQRVSVIARTSDGVSPDVAQADASRVAVDLATAYPDTNRGRGFDLLPLRREQYEFTAPLFGFVQGAALLVLCLGVVNVSGLLVARMLERRREFEIRAALGASRAQVIRLVLVEALLLTAAAGLLGLVLARWIVSALRASLPEGIARWFAGWQSIHVDGTAVGAAVLMAVAAGACLGIGGGLRAARLIATATFSRAAGSGADGGTRSRRVLVVGQVCLAVVLLVCAAVADAGFRHMSAAFESLRPDRLLTFRLGLPQWQYPDDPRVVDFQNRLLAELAAVSDVESAALIRNPPASNVPSATAPILVAGRPSLSPADAPRVDVQVVSPDLFRTLNVELIEGRLLRPDDDDRHARVGVISETMARRVWPDRNPIGATVRVGLSADSPEVRVVGVAGNLRLNWYDPEPRAVIYLPHLQAPTRQMEVIVRTRVEPSSLAGRVRRIVRTLDARQATGTVEPFADVVAESLSPIVIVGRLLSASGAVAIVLAAVGLYAALAHWVTSRRRELAVRIALGADPSTLARRVVGEAAWLVFAGAILAVPLARAGTALAGTATLGLPQAGAATVVGLVASVVVVGVSAAIVPGMRAAKSDPADLLRSD